MGDRDETLPRRSLALVPTRTRALHHNHQGEVRLAAGLAVFLNAQHQQAQRQPSPDPPGFVPPLKLKF